MSCECSARLLWQSTADRWAFTLHHARNGAGGGHDFHLFAIIEFLFCQLKQQTGHCCKYLFPAVTIGMKMRSRQTELIQP